MNNGVIDIVEYTSEIKPPKDNHKESIVSDSKESSLYLFFSLDICNSTKMKDEIEQWKKVILKLYNSQLDFRNMRIWKFVGDEVVFCTPYPGIKGLVELIKFAYNKIQAVENELTKTANKDDYKVEIKGTMWTAYISKNPDNTNIHISSIDEFLGKQIDEGFRMTHFSSNGKLLLDPKIVFILLLMHSINATIISSEHVDEKFAKCFLGTINDLITEDEKIKIKDNLQSLNLRLDITEIIKNVFFIKYERLKGIWKNYPYPIYWYSKLRSNKEYPDINSNEPLPILMRQNNQETPDYLQYYSRDLFSVFCKADIVADIKKILRVVIENEPSNPYIKSGTAQLYYSIACVKDNKVLIAKRCFSRQHLSGVWEFGFQKHTDVGTYQDICNFFSKEFGIKVNPITDGTVDKNIIPLHFCTTYRNNIKHNSILCCAEIQEDMSVEELKETINQYLQTVLKDSGNERYLEVDFVDERDIKNRFEDLTLKSVEDDSYSAYIGEPIVYNDDNHKKDGQKQKAIVYFTDSVKYVLDFYRRWCTLNNKTWYSLLSDNHGDEK